MKLYKKYSKFLYYRRTGKFRREKLFWGLTLKPGDFINDCTGFNRCIEDVSPEKWENARGGWMIYDIRIVLGNGGICSLINCGCEPAIPREQLEADYLLDYTTKFDSCYGWMKKWFSNEKDYLEALSKIQKRVDVLQSGGHFLDENGVLFSKFA